MRRDIAAALLSFPKLKVYLGVEADIVDTPNGLDVPPEDFAKYDFVNAGYHYVPKCHMLHNFVAFRMPWPKKLKEKLRLQNTDRIIKALRNNDINILTHPGEKAPVDMDAIAKACEKRGTWMEISTHHAHLTPSEIEICQKYDVSFVISSDAHMPHRVGTFKTGITKARIAGLDLDRIVNIEKI